MEVYIEAKNVTKRYGKKIILDNISLTIKQGEVIGIVGKNGVGKSTLLKILMGLIRINDGKVNFKRNLKINYIPEKFSKLDLKVSEYLESMIEIEGLNSKYYKVKMNELCNKLGLSSMINTKMKNLSKGSLQKVAIVQALMIEPDILFLDEPLSGLDIESQKVFISIIEKMISKKITIVISCHEKELIDNFATRVIRIKNKRLVNDVQCTKNEMVNMIFTKKELKEDIEEFILEFGDYIIFDNELSINIANGKANYLLKIMIEENFELIKYCIRE